jgi:hypothetical protein
MARAVFIGGVWRQISPQPAPIVVPPTGTALAPTPTLAPSTTLAPRG